MTFCLVSCTTKSSEKVFTLKRKGFSYFGRELPSPTYGEGDILILVWIQLGRRWCRSNTFFSAQYFVNQWLDSYQIFMDI